jgi:hypothetical protein
MPAKCKAENCAKEALYNFSHLKQRLYCREHKEDGMITVGGQYCIGEGCTKRPSYCNPGETKKLYCKEHSVNGSVPSSGRCIEKNCTKSALYNYSHLKKRLYCADHKLSQMVRVGVATCIAEGCTKTPSFSNPGETKRLYCAEHKNNDMLSSSKCIVEGCNKSAIYNHPGLKTRLYCGDHKSEDMIASSQKRCLLCSKYASFNKPGETEKLYCKEHSTPNMINVKKKKCIVDNCGDYATYKNNSNVLMYCTLHKDIEANTVKAYEYHCNHKDCTTFPSYNYPKEKRGIYCYKHKLPTMINIKNNTLCIEPECKLNASFGLPNTSVKLYCSTHAKDDMINLSVRRCKYNNCANYASFTSDNIDYYCGEHSDDTMININIKYCNYCNTYASFVLNNIYTCATHKLVNSVRLNKCQEEKCDKTPCFNYKGKRAAFCAMHKKPNMINVRLKYCDECEQYATYGYPGKNLLKCPKHKLEGMIKTPSKKCAYCNQFAVYGVGSTTKHCEEHKEPHEINIIEKPCKNCNLINILDCNSLCNYCNKTTNYLYQQKTIQKLFDDNNIKYVSTDKIIDNGACGKERPDFLFETPYHFVIVEVDEDQHKSRACECEQIRMVNIYNALGLPTIFIRYNPDKFKVNGQVKNITQLSRQKNLLKWVDYLIKLEPEEIIEKYNTVSVMYLYFDDYKTDDISITKLV